MLTLCIADAERDVGMKNLSRKEAITILESMKIDIPVPKAAVTQKKRNVALDMAISALSCSEIPNSSDSISRQAAIDEVRKMMCECFGADEEELDAIEVTLRELPAAQPDHVADIDKKVEAGDCISRQWLMECVNEGWIKFDTEKDENRFIHLVRDIAPSVQLDLSEYSDKLWKSAYERGKAEAQAKIIRCKDCKYWRDDHTCHEHSLVSPMCANEYCSRAKRRME